MRCYTKKSVFVNISTIYIYNDIFQEYDDSGYFWIDPVANTIKEFNTNELTSIGTAYMKPYHLDSYKPGNTV